MRFHFRDWHYRHIHSRSVLLGYLLWPIHRQQPPEKPHYVGEIGRSLALMKIFNKLQNFKNGTENSWNYSLIIFVFIFFINLTKRDVDVFKIQIIGPR